ncbi:MAG TPA: ATP-binding protein, partial [Opitutus sp.]|nr:ATP-binding protein [Opitutus sp.]
LEQFNLAKALSISGSQLLAGSAITPEFTTVGEQRRLPEVVEENLLRIAQEALTNVVKHSGATAVTVRLSLGEDDVALEVRDNGSGLLAHRISENGLQHFGLLGMAERAKRIGGRLDVAGPPGEGTSVRVHVSLRDFEASEAAPSPARDHVL